MRDTPTVELSACNQPMQNHPHFQQGSPEYLMMLIVLRPQVVSLWSKALLFHSFNPNVTFLNMKQCIRAKLGTLMSLLPTAMPISARSLSNDDIISVTLFFWWLVISFNF